MNKQGNDLKIKRSIVKSKGDEAEKKFQGILESLNKAIQAGQLELEIYKKKVYHNNIELENLKRERNVQTTYHPQTFNSGNQTEF